MDGDFPAMGPEPTVTEAETSLLRGGVSQDIEVRQ
jgi:hypothetical protein